MDAQYHRHVVTLIDILGFTALINERTAAEIDDILARFHHTTRSHNEIADALIWANREDQIPPTAVFAFSDTIVRATRVPDDAVFHALLFRELISLGTIQSGLAQQGIFLRGAVTCDELLVHEDRIFGPGLVRAHALESKYAIFPRIILDPRVRGLSANILARRQTRDAPTTTSLLFNLVTMTGEDGIAFVDYLPSSTSPQDTYESALRGHKAAVLQALGKFPTDVGVMQKLYWLRAYHNRKATQATGDGDVNGFLIGWIDEVVAGVDFSGLLGQTSDTVRG